MSAIPQEHFFRYPFPSELIPDGRRQLLRLATFRKGPQASPFFFEGQLTNPQQTAELLRAVMTVVQSRFHIPAAMLDRILAESDPMVTSNDDRLRFEGFSACCGVYVRADLLSGSFEGNAIGRGTTNVDFNPPMLAALARIRRTDEVSLAVGADKVVLKKRAGDVIEKKVALPVRWMRGLVEVQSVQSRLEPVHQISGIQAFRFFRSLPRMKTHRRATFVTKSGQGLRLSQVETRDGVRVGGLERLRVLEPLAKNADSLNVFTDRKTGASGWVLHLPDSRFHVVLSPEVWRGFSGEGQALSALASASQDALPKIRAVLKWQSVINGDQIATGMKETRKTVDAALQVLGTRGLVGFDLAEKAYFHRELPFDVSQVEKLQPRLIAARKLIDQNQVRIHRSTKTLTELRIDGSGVEHRVTLRNHGGNSSGQDAQKCTCPWFNKHQNSRGPCKHLLAAQILLEEKETGDR